MGAYISSRPSERQMGHVPAHIQVKSMPSQCIDFSVLTKFSVTRFRLPSALETSSWYLFMRFRPALLFLAIYLHLRYVGGKFANHIVVGTNLVHCTFWLCHRSTATHTFVSHLSSQLDYHIVYILPSKFRCNFFIHIVIAQHEPHAHPDGGGGKTLSAGTLVDSEYPKDTSLRARYNPIISCTHAPCGLKLLLPC